jgi:Lon protease-like protein
VPLHIFEKRYRQMVGDLLDTAGRLVMANIPRRQMSQGVDLAELGKDTPPVFPYGSLVEIVHHQKLDDGRFMILLLGLCRVSIDEVPSDRLYRKASIQKLEPTPCSTEEEHRLRPRLEAAIDERTLNQAEFDATTSIESLTDILLQCLKLTPAQLEEVFAEQDEGRRAERALNWHTTPA